jgi:hypothetical protein
MGITSSKQAGGSETINWKGVNTENISTTLNGVNGLSNQAKELILNISNNNTDTNTQTEINFDHIFQNINERLGVSDKQKLNKVLGTDYFSETSPFISSEMYSNMMNKQTGGAKKKKSKSSKKSKKSRKMKKGGSWSDDESSTTTTSSMSSDSDFDDSSDFGDSSEKKAKKHPKKHETKKVETKKVETKTESETLGGNYTSSSAHTGGEFSSSEGEGEGEGEKEEENGKYISTTNSVRTSEINMVNEY